MNADAEWRAVAIVLLVLACFTAGLAWRSEVHSGEVLLALERIERQAQQQAAADELRWRTVLKEANHDQ